MCVCVRTLMPILISPSAKRPMSVVVSGVFTTFAIALHLVQDQMEDEVRKRARGERKQGKVKHNSEQVEWAQMAPPSSAEKEQRQRLRETGDEWAETGRFGTASCTHEAVHVGRA